jgi:putative protease
MEKLIIAACICGAEVTKEHNPAVPYTVEEIVREAKSAYDAGAALIHLHVRWDDGTPTQDTARFQECVDAIRKECPDVGLEIFVHGAMCMSYSGRCLLSNFVTGRPANRGACAQLCRWKYDVILRERESGLEMPIDEDERGAYIMNSKDLCLMPRLVDVVSAGPDSLKIEGRNRSEYYVGSVVHAYRSALDAYARDPETFDPAPFMTDLNRLETRGYTTAFFDGPVTPDAHNYETTRSTSDYHAAGVITAADNDNITFELRNETHAGDTIIFIVPGSVSGVSVKLEKLINAKNGEAVEKMAAGMGNSILIPRSWVGDADWSGFVPYVLAYKHK